MSEKRFIWKCDDETCHIFDTVTKARYFYEGIMNLLNEQQATIQDLKEENGKLIQKNCIPCELVNLQTREIDKLKKENEQLRKQCFELEKDYVIETSDISDKIYLDDEIRELKKEYGVTDE